MMVMVVVVVMVMCLLYLQQIASKAVFVNLMWVLCDYVNRINC